MWLFVQIMINKVFFINLEPWIKKFILCRVTKMCIDLLAFLQIYKINDYVIFSSGF